MLIYLDANIVINVVENPAVFGPKSNARLQAISHSDSIGLSELTRTECCNYPLRRADYSLLRLYDGFFLRPDVTILPISTNVFRHATVIKAVYGFSTLDSIHLATAIENRCDLFLTWDSRLLICAEIAVEVLT